MIRVIGTINSGNGRKVRLEEYGSRKKISPRPLFRPFLKELMGQGQAPERERLQDTDGLVGGRQLWIERIPPLLDGRKRVYQQILCPYYYIIKGLSRDEAYAKVKDWFDRCIALPGASKLDDEIYYHLDYVMRRTQSKNEPYQPLSKEKLRRVYPDVYELCCLEPLKAPPKTE